MESIVFDAQTSGGIVLAVPGEELATVRDWLEARGEMAVEIGEVLRRVPTAKAAAAALAGEGRSGGEDSPFLISQALSLSLHASHPLRMYCSGEESVPEERPPGSSPGGKIGPFRDCCRFPFFLLSGTEGRAGRGLRESGVCGA